MSISRILSLITFVLLIPHSLFVSSETSFQTIHEIEKLPTVGDIQTVNNPYLQYGEQAWSVSATSEPGFRTRIAVKQQGFYQLYSWWPYPKTKTKHLSVDYQVTDHNGIAIITKSQLEGAGRWNNLGAYYVASNEDLEIALSSNDSETVYVDAFRLKFIGDEQPGITLVTSALPLAQVGSYYSAELNVEGGYGEVSWRLHGELPDGLDLDFTAGIISGIPSQAGSYDLTLVALDQNGAETPFELELVVVSALTLKPGNQTFADTGKIKGLHGSGLRTPADAPELSGQITETTSVLDEVIAMPEGSWLKLNINTFSDVWPEANLRPLNFSSNPTPSKIILAWSSFAWDNTRGDLIIFGGGHANYSGNDVYRWQSATRMWERLSYASEVTQDDFGNYRAIDGVDAAPSSAHTYDNNLYLPIADRFLTYGGAAYNNGSGFKKQINATTVRSTGPYVFNMLLGSDNKVGGTTGSHVKRVAPYPEILGGNMWTNRDLYGNSQISMPARFVNGTTAVTSENGYDVVYLSAVSGGTAQQLYKHTIVDINNPSLDQWEQVGRYWNAFNGKGAGAFSPDLNLYLRTATSDFVYWDLNNPGTNNRNVKFQPTDLSGEFVPSGNYGLDYNQVTNQFLLWKGGKDIWVLDPPAGVSATGWTIDKQNVQSTTFPNGEFGTGILGKWKFASDLNAFIGLQDINDGNVWLYKPIGWVLPNPGNGAPDVNLTSPINNASYALGDTITLQATASDSDGTVDYVSFYQNGALIAQDNSEPYLADFVPASSGPYNLAAIATDNGNASSASDSVVVDVIGSNQAPTVNLTAPAEGSEFPPNQTLTLVADADDADGFVALVEFFVDGNKIGDDQSAPYQSGWTPSSEGDYTLTSTATDNEGNTSASAGITVSVAIQGVPPMVSLDSPSPNALFGVGDTIVLSASANDSDGSVAAVAFYWGLVKLGEDVSPPYQFNWSNAPEGNHELLAVATDDEGLTGFSASVNVSVVDNNAAPTVSLDTPQNGAIVESGESLQLSATAADADGTIARVEFYDGTELIAEVFSAPYQTNWLASSLGARQLSAVAIDDQGLVSTPSGVGVSVVGAGGGSTVSLTLQDGLNGYDGTRDTYLSVWGKDTGFGNRTYFYDRNNTYVALVKFAIFASEGGPVPDGAVIESAKLSFYKYSSYNYTYQVSRLQKAWLEQEASWNRAAVGVPWAVPGAAGFGQDTNLVADAEASVDWSAGWLEFDVTAGVEAMTLGAENQGWRVVAISGNNNIKRFYSRESTVDEGLRPKLDITYSFNSNVPPEVALAAPVNGASYTKGDSVLLSASASDSDGSIDSVEFFWNDNSLGEVTNAPYQLTWQNVPDGVFDLTAKAKDNSNGVAVSSPVTITVIDPNVAPEISLDSPLPGAVYDLGQAIDLVASAMDIDGTVEQVEFYLGVIKLGEVFDAPYQISWNNAPEGTHGLTAVAIDNHGKSSVSAVVQVTVIDNNVAPTVTFDSPVTGTQIETGQNLLLEATAFDSDGVIDRVEFYEGTSQIGSVSTAPYQLYWTASQVGTRELRVIAVDNNGVPSAAATTSVTVTNPGGGLSVSVTLQDGSNGYAGTQDAYVSSWHKNTNYGSRTYMFDQRSRFVKLLKFAVFVSEGGPVPDNATIESATLSLYKYSSYDYSYQIYGLLKPWNESEVTWNEASAGVPWAAGGAQQPGEDIALAAESQSSIDWQPAWLEFDVSASLGAISAGDQNNGWIIDAMVGNGNRKRYYSRESTVDIALRPKLTITYSE